MLSKEQIKEIELSLCLNEQQLTFIVFSSYKKDEEKEISELIKEYFLSQLLYRDLVEENTFFNFVFTYTEKEFSEKINFHKDLKESFKTLIIPNKWMKIL